MKKAATILSVISIALVFLSVIGFAIVVLAREPLGELQYGSGFSRSVGRMPARYLFRAIPYGELLRFLTLGLAAVLLAAAFKAKGTWPEILGLILAGALAGTLALCGAEVQYLLIRKGAGMVLTLFEVMGRWMKYAAIPANLAQVMMLLACGMRLADKKRA